MTALLVLALLSVVIFNATLTYLLYRMDQRAQQRANDEAMGNQYRRPVRGNPAEVIT